jgi:hypothetical protein
MTLALRATMQPVTRRVRTYFAPVDRTTETPAVFDPAKYGAFVLDTPPAPWLDLGWITNFQRWSRTATDALRTGARGAPARSMRGALDAEVEFDFREWGKLQMALQAGSQHMNVLATGTNSTPQPSGGASLSAVPLLPGSTATELQVGAGPVVLFSLGNLVAVDVDYQQQTGYVGTGLAAAYVRNAQDVQHSVDYVRRVTFNVGRVSGLTSTSLVLAQPLLGGTPASGAAVQRVVAFVDREGGSFFQEWSALFVMEEENGARICFYYPRLAPLKKANAGSAEQSEKASGIAGAASSLGQVGLHASFLAMPVTDVNDGEQILCYRSFFPAASAALY